MLRLEFKIEFNLTLMMRLILYSKPGCHLCEGLQEKLGLLMESLKFQLEVRDITDRNDWFQAYQYEVPVLFKVQPLGSDSADAASSPLEQLPRPSPRCTVAQLEQMLQKYLQTDRSK
jgi:hypothetical protein